MRIVVSSEVTIYDPTDGVMAYCLDNLTVKNPDYARKLRMGLWLGNTPEYLDLYKQRGEHLILPFGAYQGLQKYLWQNDTWDSADIDYDYDLPGNDPVEYEANIPLYDYQEIAVKAMLFKGYGILQAPAGSGKTHMGIAMIAETKQKALWITHTKDLLKQSYDRAAQYIDTSLLGRIANGKVHIGSGITFATVQTLAKMDLSQYKYEWDMIIVDECHRAAGTPAGYSQFSKVLNSLASCNKYGLSATVHRADGMIKATFALLGDIGYTVPDEATADTVMQVRVLRRDTKIPIYSSCQDTDGTLLYANLLQYLTENSIRNRVIASDLVKNRAHYNLILSDRINHLRELYEALPYDLQEQAALIHGGTKAGAREQAIEEIRSGKKRYLFASYQLAKEGLDIPRLDRLYLTTPQKDYAIIVQAVGRIARQFEGKAEPVVYDYVDDIIYCRNQWKKRCTSYRKAHCKM